MSLEKTILGGIDFAQDLMLRGLESRSMVATSVVHTLGGKAYVQSDVVDLVVGQPLTLGNAHPYFTLAQLQAVQLLAGNKVTLVHHRGTFLVLVIAVPEEPEIDCADPVADGLYGGEIEMILLEIVELT